MSDDQNDKPKLQAVKDSELKMADKIDTSILKPEETIKPPEEYNQLLNKIVDAKKAVKDVYTSIESDDKHTRVYWRPLEKEITLLFMEFSKTFFFKEHMKRKEAEEKALMEQRIKAQEKLK